jgi:hypothetical protein
MKATTWVKAVLVLVVCVGGRGAALAQTPPGTDVIRDVVEPVSGARLRIYRAPLGEAVFDVSNPEVSIDKRVSRAGSVTTIATADERVSLLVTPTRVVVEGLGDTLELAKGSRADADILRARFAASKAVRRAVNLLEEVRLPMQSPMFHALQAARMLLETASGVKATPRSSAILSDLLQRQRTTVRVQQGPGDCWTSYAMEAIATYIEYEQCVDGEQWWDVFGMMSCLAIYELRAIGAASWYLNCVGFGSWVG